MAIAATEILHNTIWYEETTEDGKSFVVRDQLVQREDYHELFDADLRSCGGGVPQMFRHETERIGPMTQGEAALILVLMEEQEQLV